MSDDMVKMLKILNESINEDHDEAKFYVEKDDDDGNHHVFDSKTGKSVANYSDKSDADKECKKMNDSLKESSDNKDEDEIKEAPEETNKEEEKDMKIKPAMGFERYLKLLFNEEDLKVGRIALRKILSGKEDTLTLRERGTVAKSAMRLYPVLAEDRVTFQRMEKALKQ